MSTTPIPVPPAPRKVNSTVIILAIAGGVLLLVVVALLFLMLGRGLGAGDNATVQGSATPSPAPSTSPSASQDAEEPAPEPEDTTPRFTSFTAQTEVQCPADGEKPEITFSWETAYATEVWYTSGHEDAKDDNYMQVPLSGNQNDLTDEHLFPCNHRQSEDYTVTLVGEDGSHVSEYFTVTDLNWNSGGDDSDD